MNRSAVLCVLIASVFEGSLPARAQAPIAYEVPSETLPLVLGQTIVVANGQNVRAISARDGAQLWSVDLHTFTGTVSVVAQRDAVIAHGTAHQQWRVVSLSLRDGHTLWSQENLPYIRESLLQSGAFVETSRSGDARFLDTLTGLVGGPTYDGTEMHIYPMDGGPHDTSWIPSIRSIAQFGHVAVGTWPAVSTNGMSVTMLGGVDLLRAPTAPPVWTVELGRGQTRVWRDEDNILSYDDTGHSMVFVRVDPATGHRQYREEVPNGVACPDNARTTAPRLVRIGAARSVLWQRCNAFFRFDVEHGRLSFRSVVGNVVAFVDGEMPVTQDDVRVAIGNGEHSRLQWVHADGTLGAQVPLPDDVRGINVAAGVVVLERANAHADLLTAQARTASLIDFGGVYPTFDYLTIYAGRPLVGHVYSPTTLTELANIGHANVIDRINHLVVTYDFDLHRVRAFAIGPASAPAPAPVRTSRRH